MAVRGAITTQGNEHELIVAATAELLEAMLRKNAAAKDDVISLIFTSTGDLTAAFPAVAARELGMAEIPLLCAREIEVPDSLPYCIRVLMHLYSDRSRAELEHVYLGEARSLRDDLSR